MVLNPTRCNYFLTTDPKKEDFSPSPCTQSHYQLFRSSLFGSKHYFSVLQENPAQFFFSIFSPRIKWSIRKQAFFCTRLSYSSWSRFIFLVLFQYSFVLGDCIFFCFWRSDKARWILLFMVFCYKLLYLIFSTRNQVNDANYERRM